MIFSLIGDEANGNVKLPNVYLDENKRYEIRILHFGGILTSVLKAYTILKLQYDGIRAQNGSNPYTMHFYPIGSNRFYSPSGGNVFFPLRTNQLGVTSFKYEIEGKANSEILGFLQIEIREVNDKNQ